MLDVFRSNSRSVVIYVLLGIVILAFILTFNTQGPVRGPGVGVEVMAEVAGTQIDSGELNLAMSLTPDPPPADASPMVRMQAKQNYESTRLPYSGVPLELASLTPFVGEVPALKLEKVMTELIESILVARDASGHGLAVSDAELTHRVLRLQRTFGTTFNDDKGVFDPRKYEVFVRFNLGTSKTQFEGLLRREILRDKMAQVVTSGVTVAKTEAEALARVDRDRPRLEYVAIDADNARKAIVIADEEADSWANDHDAEIAAAYAAKSDLYKKPARWQVRGLFVEVAPDASDEDKAAKKAEAESARADLDKAWSGETPIAPPSAGESDTTAEAQKVTDVPAEDQDAWRFGHFSTVAGEKTDHMMTKDVGGAFSDPKDAAGLGRTPFGPAVADAVANAAVGSLVGPIGIDGGWWVIAVEKKIDAEEIALDEVRRELAKELLAEAQAATRIDEFATSVLAKAKELKDKPLADAVEAWNEANGGTADGPFAAVTSGAIGRSPVAALQGGLEEMLGLPPRDFDPADIPGMGNLPEVAEAAWKLTAVAPLADKVFKSADDKTRYIVRLAPVEAPVDDDAKKAQDRNVDQLRLILVDMRKKATWRGYVRKLIEDAEKAGDIDRSESWSAALQVARERWLAEQQRAAAKGAPAGASPLQVQIGGQQVPVQPMPVAPPADQAPPPAAPVEQAPPPPAPEQAPPAAAE